MSMLLELTLVRLMVAVDVVLVGRRPDIRYDGTVDKHILIVHSVGILLHM